MEDYFMESENNETGGGMIYESYNGKKLLIPDDSQKVTINGKEYCIGIDITEEGKYKYAIIGKYIEDGKSYIFIDNDPEIFAQLVEAIE